MEATIKLTPEIIEVETQSLTIPEQAKAIKIVDTESYIEAGDLWKGIRSLREKVSDSFDPLIKHAHALHKATLAKKSEIDKPLEDAERAVKKAMSGYDLEQERIRREEERRLAEIARKKEEDRLLQEAIAAEEEARRNGATTEEAAQEAAAIMEEPVYVTPVQVPKAVPKLQGGPVYRTVWKARIVNESLIPRKYLTVDTAKINSVVRSLRNQHGIPGIEAYEERV